MNDTETGLYKKYDVFKAGTGEKVDDCFVLRPERDPAALAALWAYVKASENDELRQDLMEWMDSIPRLSQEETKTLREWGVKYVTRDEGAEDCMLWRDTPKYAHGRYFGDALGCVSAKAFPWVMEGEEVEVYGHES